MSLKAYGIVGNGRLAKHLTHYFRLKQLNVAHWDRKMGRSVPDVLGRCDVIIVAINDDAIEGFIKKNSWLKNRIVIHCSGSLVTKLAQGFHPLFNFTGRMYKEEVYEKIPFVFEKGKHTFHDLFPELPNPSYSIPKTQRAFYHALSVICGNFPTILWQEVAKQYRKKLKLPPDIFIPYIQNCIEEFKMNPDSSLTGPFVRKDKKTVEKNIRSLGKTDLGKIYKAFKKEYF